MSRSLIRVLAVALPLVTLAASVQPEGYDRAPEFPSSDPALWIGPPQSLKALEGKVVILDVWTFG
jgi:hypothetical protein